jgi:hypothetical protein
MKNEHRRRVYNSCIIINCITSTATTAIVCIGDAFKHSKQPNAKVQVSGNEMVISETEHNEHEAFEIQSGAQNMPKR